MKKLIIVMMFLSLYSCFAGEIDINSEKTQTEIEVFKQTYEDAIDKTIEIKSPYSTSEGGHIKYFYNAYSKMLFFDAHWYSLRKEVNWKCYFVRDNLYYFEKIIIKFVPKLDENFELDYDDPLEIGSKEVMPVIFFNDESYLLNKENNLWEKTDNDEYHTTLTELLDNVDKPDFDKSSSSVEQGVE